MKVLFVHLLNNYTGSPRVLSNLLEKLSSNTNFELHLLTSNSEGSLSNIVNIQYHYNTYNWSTHKIILALKLCVSQIYQFFFVLFSIHYSLIYINTILPFGAAIAAKLRGIRCIYHIHEYYPKPNIMQKICLFFARKCATEVIFVSEYLKNCYVDKFLCRQTVIYNTISQEFHNKAAKYNFPEGCAKERYMNKIIVMPCGLKKYKGLFEFIKVANNMPDFNFVLVISNPRSESERFFKDTILPSNLKILNEIKDMTIVYHEASLVMNMSLPYGNDIFIETFAMTLIEAFEFGIPCIAPGYGGPVEVIEDKKTGFLVDPFETDYVIQKIRAIFESFEIYKYFSINAKKRGMFFSVDDFYSSIMEIIQN